MLNKHILGKILKSDFFYRGLSTQQTRFTFVLRHVIMPERINDGSPQRNPNEKQEFQKYEVIENEDTKPPSPVKVILLEDVEGMGLQFDIVMVKSHLARDFLFPTKKAVYASPFDLEYYAKKKEAMKEELENRVRIPYELLKLGRSLMDTVIPISVSMDNPWSINKEIIMASMLEAGFNFTRSPNLHIPGKYILKGPNFDVEASLIRFYLVINSQYIVPILGRIMHISSESSKQNLYPAVSKLPTEAQMKKFGIKAEEAYYQNKPFKEDFNVIEFMEKI